nr:hypothetical protein [Tanacetum cinerariifolium]
MDDLPRGLAYAAKSVRDAIGFESHVLWAEIGESSLTGLELVQETTDKVVLVRKSPRQREIVKRAMLIIGGKLAPRYVEPFDILERIGSIAYANLHVSLDEIEADKTLYFVEETMSADVARGHGGDGGGDDRPPPYQVPTGCGGCLGNRGKGIRKPNLGGRRAGRLHTRQETRNLGLNAITDKSGPANHPGELVREFPLHYPSWRQMPPERKAGVVAKIGAALKERYWVPEEDVTYDLERFKRGRPSHIFEMETSTTREYPSLNHTFFLTHTVGGVFFNLEDKALYGTVIPSPSQSTHSTDIARLKKSEKRLTKQVNMFMRLFRSDDKFSQMLRQLESQPEYGGGSGSDGCGDDEPGDDEDGGEDEEDEDDS